MTRHYQTLILGGGLSGLTVAHKLKKLQPGHRFCILEKSSRTGGVIGTKHDQGYISELGPHGFLDNCEESKQILAETGLDQECIKAPLIDFVRYVYLHGRLNLIPQTPGKILKAPLIPWQAKLRVLGDLLKPCLEGEPTVAKWANYRFGPALLPFLDAVYTGTYAGDFNKLTIDSVMPGVRALEKEYGSVIKGLVARMLEKRRLNRGEKKQKFSMPAMTSFPSGMQRLPERLTEELKKDKELQLNCAISSIDKTEDGWEVTTNNGRFRADNLVCALPINVALKLFAPLESTIPETSVPEAWLGTVVFGFKDTVKLPPGFGYLTPEEEKRFTLGTLFSSNMFPGRAPEGHVVFETLVGGRRHPEKLDLSDEELTAKALSDVQDILKIKATPTYSSVLRSAGGIPQLERNYPQLLNWREELQTRHNNLQLVGFGWEGIGLNEMMKCGCRAAEAIIASSTRGKEAAEVKGIYF